MFVSGLNSTGMFVFQNYLRPSSLCACPMPSIYLFLSLSFNFKCFVHMYNVTDQPMTKTPPL